MPVSEVPDADLYTMARDTLALMDAGIPWDAIQGMHPRVRQAYVTALHDMMVDREIAQDVVDADADGTVN